MYFALCLGLLLSADAKPIELPHAYEVFEAYKDNAVAADMKYEGKTVSIKQWSGSGDKLEKDGAKYTYWINNGADQANFFAVCQLSAEGAKQYGTMKADDRAKWNLVGTVKGTMKSKQPFNEFVIVIADCRFVKR